MKTHIFLLAAAATALLSSCGASIATPAGVGALYTDIQHGEAVTANSVGTKVGTATANNILGLVTMGDASITAAAKSAGIRKISHIDAKKTNLLGIFSTYTIYVYGE